MMLQKTGSRAPSPPTASVPQTANETALAVDLTASARRSAGGPRAPRAPRVLFGIELAYVGVLFLGAALFAQWGVFPHVLPDPIGPVPLAIPWLGALGAVTIGLYGFFTHQHAWDNAYEYWHVARPVTGAILGVLAYFIFVAVVNAATATAQPPAPTGAGATPQGRFVYYIVAFLVGYREQTFQALVQRVTDLLFTPVEGGKATPAAEAVGRPQSADGASGS